MNTTESTSPAAPGAVAAPKAAPVAAKPAAGTKTPTARKNAPKAATRVKKGAKASKPAKKAAKPATAPRAGSKKEIIFDLLRRKSGATLAELMAATKWQAHSVRGFISTSAKTHKIGAEITDAGRRYRIAK